MFVDLAGSERIAKSQAEAMRAEEAKNINTSLSALGRVINALSSTGSKGFVPYRDCALTMLMKESLCGNCQTSLLVTVAEAAEWQHETVSSLRFGLSCGRISKASVKS
jgi:kinesin family protein 5